MAATRVYETLNGDWVVPVRSMTTILSLDEPLAFLLTDAAVGSFTVWFEYSEAQAENDFVTFRFTDANTAMLFKLRFG